MLNLWSLQWWEKEKKPNCKQRQRLQTKRKAELEATSEAKRKRELRGKQPAMLCKMYFVCLPECFGIRSVITEAIGKECVVRDLGLQVLLMQLFLVIFVAIVFGYLSFDVCVH